MQHHTPWSRRTVGALALVLSAAGAACGSTSDITGTATASVQAAAFARRLAEARLHFAPARMSPGEWLTTG